MNRNLLLTFIPLFSLVAAGAAAQTAPIGLPQSGASDPYSITFSQAIRDTQFQQALQKIRKSALLQQSNDGGQLTKRHSAVIQEKINSAQIEYKRASKRQDLFSLADK